MDESIEIRHRSHAQAVLDAHAAHLRLAEDYTIRQIADEMKCSTSTAHARFRRGYAMMPGRKAADQKAADLQELDDVARAAWLIAERPHVMVQNGKVVTMTVTADDGTKVTRPVPDDRQSLEALDRVLRVQERRAHLEALDAPRRSQHEVTVHDGNSDLDREIAGLLAGMARMEQSTPPVEAPGSGEPTNS